MKKILVIEETAKTRSLFLTALQLEGFNVLIAENGFIGLQKAQEYLPDLIISEVLVSEIDGFSILRQLRQNTLTVLIPLIFVTEKVTRSDIRKGMELGADDYLTKPCTVEELLRAIAACLKKRDLLRQLYTEQSQAVVSVNTIKLANCQSIFPSNSQLMKVFNFIENNYHQPLTLGDVAQEVGYSPAYLTNLVRRITGKTVQSWIIERRMAAARSLLILTSERVEKIAAKVGYHNTVHFFRQFRQHHATTPHAWRKMQLDQEKHHQNNC